MAWFFMLRKSEFLIGLAIRGTDWKRAKRRPICNTDLLPRRNREFCKWDEEPDEVVMFLKGSKTDWLNQGAVRNHSALPGAHKNKELCLVSALVRLFGVYPGALEGSEPRPIAMYRNGQPITAYTLARVLKRGVGAHGANPDTVTLHSLRAGGATALCQSTGSMESVRKLGRWKSDAASVYLWESYEQLQGLSGAMASGGHELHAASLP